MTGLLGLLYLPSGEQMIGGKWGDQLGALQEVTMEVTARGVTLEVTKRDGLRSCCILKVELTDLRVKWKGRVKGNFL